MNEAIAAALIAAGASLAVQLIISFREKNERQRIAAAQSAVLLHRLDSLEEKVEKQNALFERLYKTEADMTVLKNRLESFEIRC